MADRYPRRAETSAQEIDSPMSGELVSLRQVPDELFSSGAMGEGVAILPDRGEVVAPCDGAVLYSLQFSHAIGVVAEGGAEILIHIGLDAQTRAGGLFRFHVKEDQAVKRGDLLLTMNLDAMERKSLYALVTVTNSGDYSSVHLSGEKKICAGDRLMTVS